ncbi:hypothetical protein [Amycolatopsis anabasis]|uniref:hypothetical protein n=1 Tax=Amycolatopsis anabasis TaxID=1840409 RepID=UPI00131AB59C|nr:hypothetical protein [Amycolatopsis anabasis]
MRKTTAAVLLAAGMLAACAPGVPEAPPVPPAPPPPSAPPAQHQVTVKVTGPEGSVFRVSGAVFGDTGLIDMPAGGADSASFTTTDTSNLGLSVSVMPGPNPRTCAIEVDGTAMVSGTADGDNPVTCTATHAT